MGVFLGGRGVPRLFYAYVYYMCMHMCMYPRALLARLGAGQAEADADVDVDEDINFSLSLLSLSVSFSFCLSACLSVCLSVCLLVCLSVCLSHNLFVSHCNSKSLCPSQIISSLKKMSNSRTLLIFLFSYFFHNLKTTQ